MCGIAGIVCWREEPDQNLVRRMTLAMHHRGPDARKVIQDRNVVLGHSRLAIIDLSEDSNQPMHDPESGLWIVFNGEIYNFRELRSELETLGNHFHTKSDTEVVLKAYAQWGVDSLQRFNGMFSFAIWNRLQQQLFLARDRAGEKPLFFQKMKNGGLIFASELKALRLHPEVSDQLNPAALCQYLTSNHVYGNTCILKGVEKLPAAHYMICQPANIRGPVEYWNLAKHFQEKQHFRSVNEAAEALRGLIDKSVHTRLVSDVPLGGFLSGGLDSSAIVASMAKQLLENKVSTFSIGFQEDSYSELSHARTAAIHLDVNHREEVVDIDIAQDLPKIVRCADEPFADNSIIPFYHLSRFAQQHVKVCLSGDGGDELFAGYETYLADRLRSLTSWIPRIATTNLARITNTLLPTTFRKVSWDYKIQRLHSVCTSR